jgi:hypothetical protein
MLFGSTTSIASLSRLAFEDEEGIQDWIFDDLDVGAGLDAEEAVNKVKAFVKTEEYGVKVTGFRLKQVKLLAHADLI